jgi:hypothetical protein
MQVKIFPQGKQPAFSEAVYQILIDTAISKVKGDVAEMKEKGDSVYARRGPEDDWTLIATFDEVREANEKARQHREEEREKLRSGDKDRVDTVGNVMLRILVKNIPEKPTDDAVEGVCDQCKRAVWIRPALEAEVAKMIGYQAAMCSECGIRAQVGK